MPLLFGEAWPEFPPDDFALIRQPLDFLGINYYKRGITKADPSNPIEKAARVDDRHATHTVIGWEVFPAGLTDILVWVKERYGDIPLYVTENGAAFYDPPEAEDGCIEDPLRTAYLEKHIGASGSAIAAGVDLRGYFVWSLLDNFEWSQGYSARFGIVHVDYRTQKRTLKKSARTYAAIIRGNGNSD
jgi:beta-glucosidase